jgi:AcrR family transcriptional regulator
LKRWLEATMKHGTSHNGDRHGGNETRERLLAAAVKLFARKGFEATPVRDITAEAGCNVAAVNYHFGSKDNLYLEAFRSILGELRDRRIDSLDREMSVASEMDLEGFLEAFAKAFMEPLVNEYRGEVLMALISREMLDPHLPAKVFSDEFLRPIVEISTAAMQRVGPPMDRETVHLCLMSVVGQLLHVLRARRVFLAFQHPETEIDMADILRHIVRFSTGGIRECAAPWAGQPGEPLVAEGSG